MKAFFGAANMMWIILCGGFIAAASLMMASWGEAKVELHPWLAEQEKAPARAVHKTRLLRAGSRR
jgi:hypothetical protein